MTIIVLYDLLYSVWHRIDQRLTIFSDFGFLIPYPDYCLYNPGFGCTVFIVQSKFNYRPQILDWIESGEFPGQSNTVIFIFFM